MSSNLPIIQPQVIENRIFTIRGVQVMLDSHLAEMYGVETKVFNQAVKRNLSRFPEQFMFQLNDAEWDSLRYQIGTLDNLRSQIVTSNSEPLRSQNASLDLRYQIGTSSSESLRSQFATLDDLRSQNATSSEKRGGRRYLPYVFTEQGVAMLSAVLRSETAVNVSIQIMNAFVEMRKLIAGNATIFQRLDRVELRQIEADDKFERIFRALESHEPMPEQGIFFDGQTFDAYNFVADLIRSAEKSIILIDNYIDESVLLLLTKRKHGVKAVIYTKISKVLELDVAKHNSQYEPIELKEFALSHDRFLMLDDKELYHIGASLKDLGKKWFGFSKMETETISVLNKLQGNNK